MKIGCRKASIFARAFLLLAGAVSGITSCPEATLAANGKTLTGGVIEKASKGTLQFHPKLVSTSNYVFNNCGEELNHKLQSFSSTCGDYKLQTQIVDDSGLISIRLFYKGKQVLYRHLPKWSGLCEASFDLTDPRTSESCNTAPVFRDINGDGIPEIILSEDSGSAHGPMKLTIYQIKPSTAPLPMLCQATLQSPTFSGPDENGTYRVNVYDQAFSYWKDSAYCDFAPPTVVLSLQGHAFVPNAKLMIEPPPKEAEFQSVIAHLNKELADADKLTKPGTRAVRPAVWNAMNEYVYSGRAEWAKKILDRLYPEGTTLIMTVNNVDELKDPKAMPKLSRKQFWKDFCDTVKHSEYAKVLLQLDTTKAMQSQ
jgi:hypothetical protein